MLNIFLISIIFFTLMIILIWSRLDALAKLSQTIKADIGVEHGKLRQCPDSPNCICTQYPEDKTHFVLPIKYQNKTVDDVMNKILAYAKNQPYLKITRQTSVYLHCIALSPTMKFHDDLEFLIDEEHSQIHVRSAARVGYSDMGANKNRVETLRKILA